MTKEEWIKIYNAKDGIWDKDDLIDKAYEIISSPIKTNYDRIKSMSVEEMAQWIYDIQYDIRWEEKICACCECFDKKRGCIHELLKPDLFREQICTDTYMDWLLQEIKNEY